LSVNNTNTAKISTRGSLDSEIKIVGEPFTQEYYGIATNLSNNSLIQAVNEALRSIKNGGTLKKIQDKWTKS